MLATIIAYYHNFLFLQSTALSYLYGFVFFAAGMVFARFDSRIRHLMAVGTAAGFVELLGDHFLVQIADSLRYPSLYPRLLSSPAYMPFAWAILVVFMGYLGLRLGEEFGAGAASLGPAVFAFTAESGFESLASLGGGWTYVSAPLGWIGSAPLYIVFAEALMFSTVTYWVKRDWLRGGLGMGFTINASYVIVFYAFKLVDILVTSSCLTINGEFPIIGT